MNTILSRRLILLAALFLFPALLVSFDMAKAEHDFIEGLAGPPFSDPSVMQEMPEDWEKRPIKYKDSAGAADLVITLDQQMYPALEPIIQEYASKQGLKIFVKNGTCGLSAGMLSHKEADIGGYCCAPGVTDRLPGLRFHTLGISSIALFVHPDNPIENITIEQARQIFMGEIFRWSELETSRKLKGKKLLIKPVGRLHCKQRMGHWRLLLNNEELFSSRLIEVGAIPDMISQVASDVKAIGYETLWMTRLFKNKGTVKVLKIDGHDPDNPSPLLSGKYPLYRVYSITSWEGEGVSNPHTRKLVDYLLKRFEALESKYSFVPSSRLRQAGWIFHGNELVGIPQR